MSTEADGVGVAVAARGAGLATGLRWYFCHRSQTSCTRSSASLALLSMRYAIPNSRGRSRMNAAAASPRSSADSSRAPSPLAPIRSYRVLPRGQRRRRTEDAVRVPRASRQQQAAVAELVPVVPRAHRLGVGPLDQGGTGHGLKQREV
jgi:hypothetical protein